MKIFPNKIAVLAVLFFVSLTGPIAMPVAHAQNETEAQTKDEEKGKDSATTFKDSMLKALQQADYNAFIANADANFKILVPVQAFLSISNIMAPRLANGDQQTYLTSLNKQGAKVYVWKITFEDKGDDLIATIGIRDDKVIGFFLS